MILDILLVIIVLIALGGFGLGWGARVAGPTSPVGLALGVLVILLLAALIWPYVPLYHPYAVPPTVDDAP